MNRIVQQIKSGIVPDGYKKTEAGIIPCDWSCAKLSEIAEPITQTVGEDTYETVSISAGIGFVNQAEKFGREISGEQYKKYTVLHKGDFAYNKGNSGKYPQGCIYRLKDRETAAVPNVFECFRIKTGCAEYYDQLFTSGFLNHQLYRLINHGVRDDGLLNLTQEDFYSCVLPVPPIHEQMKIATVLERCDQTIQLWAEKTEVYKTLKKICLRKMFPQGDSRIPEIRFARFTNDWEQRKLGDIGTVAMCRRVFKHQTTDSGEIPFFKIGTFGGTPDAFISRGLFEDYKSKYPYPDEGDILISASGSIGRTVEFSGKDEYFQDSNIVWLKHDKSITNPFLRHLYEVVKWAGVEGSTIKRLYNDNILRTEIVIPAVPEQIRIAEILDGIDNLITLHQRKCDEEKAKKNSMTQLLLTGIVRALK